MKYAIIGDLHSSFEDTRAVLQHIKSLNLSKSIIGLGDLFECKIGKRKLATLTGPVDLEEAAIIKKKFVKLLTFRSVIGNQEERIAQVTENYAFLNYPESICLENAKVIHGHQFRYNDDFDLSEPPFEEKIIFFGHTHNSAIYINGEKFKIQFDKPYDLSSYEKVVVNVGSVINKREWAIYDSDTQTVIFKKSKENA